MVLYLLNNLLERINQKYPYFLEIFISVGLKLVPGINLDFIYCVNCVSSLSIPWFLYLFRKCTFIAFGCIKCFIWCLWFLCFVDCVNLLFFWNRRSYSFPYHIKFCFPFLSTISVVPSLTTVSVEVDNSFLVSYKSPLDFLTFSRGLSDSSVNDDIISVLDILHPVNSIISSSF